MSIMLGRMVQVECDCLSLLHFKHRMFGSHDRAQRGPDAHLSLRAHSNAPHIGGWSDCAPAAARVYFESGHAVILYESHNPGTGSIGFQTMRLNAG